MTRTNIKLTPEMERISAEITAYDPVRAEGPTAAVRVALQFWHDEHRDEIVPQVTPDVHKMRLYEIVTSGGLDRYLRPTTIFYVSHQARGRTIALDFDDADEVLSYMQGVLGLSWDEAMKILSEAEAVQRIQATIYAERRWHSVPMSDEDLNSVTALLKLRREKKSHAFTEEAIQSYEEQLEQHPLSEKLHKIVMAQLQECDRKNELLWGHPDGRDHVREGGEDA